jgi:hypothetical protein
MAAEDAVNERRVRELLDLVGSVVASMRDDEVRGDTGAMLVLGQRVLLKLIPFVEPLGRNGAARRAILVSLVNAAEQAAQDGKVRTVLGAVKQGLALNVDGVLVAALQDTEMLGRAARGCGGCLLNMFQRYFRQHAPAASEAAPAPPAANDPPTSAQV